MSDNVLKQRWYVVDQVHLPPGASPYIIAGHWDAHVGQIVCDTLMPHELESDDDNPDWDQLERDAIAEGWAVCRHIVELHNAAIEAAPREGVSEAAIVKAWANANFGPTADTHEGRVSIIVEALGKYAQGYETGHTITMICRELGLVRRVRSGQFALTQEGLGWLVTYGRPPHSTRKVAHQLT